MSATGRESLPGLFRDASERLEPALAAAVTRPGAGSVAFQRALAYTALLPAKRFRPALALGACRALGGEEARAVPLMVSLELLHTYSLVHDDLPCMDDDALRRGHETLHRVVGEGLAVLAGDALQGLAFEVLAEAALAAADGGRRELGALGELARAAGPAGMTAGQSLDLAAAGGVVAREEVLRIHALKTGALLGAAAAGGAWIAGAGPEARDRMREFGIALGVAFQTADDLLNEKGDPSRTGKGVGTDRSREKATLPAVDGVDGAERTAREWLRRAEGWLAPLGSGADPLRELARYAVQRDR